MDEFLLDNADGFDDEDRFAIRALAPGESLSFGGGAAPIFVLRRVA